MKKPSHIHADLAAIPSALTVEDRWVLWRYLWSQREGHAGRWIKLPCQTNGHPAKPNELATWTTFADASAAFEAGRFDGVGFCLGDGWAGIDFDHCRSEAGVIAEAAVMSVCRITAYIEVSPSGTGFKAIGRAPRIGGQVDFDPLSFTTWNGPRFFTVTGHQHGDGPPTVDISDVIEEWFPARSREFSRADVPSYLRAYQGDTRGTEQIERLTDDQVVARILASPQAGKFARLVRGDLSEYGLDHSRADQALVSILAYWCQGDLEQVDRMFRQSGLMRPKWESSSYRRATLQKAVAS